MLDTNTIRSLLLIVCFIIFSFIFIIKKQNKKLNWSIFYASLWVSFSLGIVNYICVANNFWSYNSANDLTLKIPLDLYFVWVFFWGILPMYFAKGKHTFLLTLLILWLDIILMPELEKLGIIKLNKNWIIGEIIIIFSVWLPSYLWAKFYFNNTNHQIRSLFQVFIMTIFLLLIIPFSIKIQTNNIFILPNFNPYLFQIIFIIAFPSLIAVIDLTTKGKGTPFPYDKTTNLVRNGVYAYCRNPIQWSFTLIFIPLAFLYNSPLLALGTIISIAYTIGVSNFQEGSDMHIRFGNEWIEYKKNVPTWLFLWKPKQIPVGTIFFKRNCNQCEQIMKWFTKSNALNLQINFSDSYKGSSLLQVTYVDYNKNEYKSISAIAHALEHINLAYAVLGWFMRFPFINGFLKLIIDTMDFNNENECSLNNQ